MQHARLRDRLATETSSAGAAHQVLVRTEQPGALRAGALRSKELRFIDHKMQRIPVTPVEALEDEKVRSEATLAAADSNGQRIT